MLKLNFPKEKILFPKYGKVIGYNGWEYFDYFEPNENEIFVDGGCYNGRTAFEFSQWAKKGYDYIYSFEADSHSMDNCEETFKRCNLKGEVINKGLWNKQEVLKFQSAKNSSKISDEGTEKIETVALDEILNGKKVTFIKMDIEGAEYKALLGCEQTIKKYRPRLAICIYHKPEDIFELPSILLQFQPNYKFALRQYRLHGSSGVLYAY